VVVEIMEEYCFPYVDLCYITDILVSKIVLF
jgi:hypothetical protein